MTERRPWGQTFCLVGLMDDDDDGDDLAETGVGRCVEHA
jgi:hypothetical protein